MKYQITKSLSVLALSFFLVLSSCQKEAKTEAPKEESTVPARVASPQPSPASTLMQKVGLTDVTIKYSRPGMKGREIFGDLVPYDKVWRTGANENTTITTSTDFMIDGKTIPAGTYAIYTKPGKNSWEVMLYSDAKNWGNPQKWDDSKVVASTTVDVMEMPINVETFTITVDDITNNSALIGMMWEKAYVGLPITVDTDKAVMASIDEVLSGEPNARAYYDAAVYYRTEDKDIDKALVWIDRAIEMTKEDPKFWMLRQQSLIHAKAGKKETAIAAAKKSLELAEKAGNEGYVKMNKASLKEWGAM